MGGGLGVGGRQKGGRIGREDGADDGSMSMPIMEWVLQQV